MVAFNFQKQFVELIENGKKRQTCRHTPRCHPGSKLQLYYAQRTKRCRKIMDAICTAVTPIRFDRDFLSLDNQCRTTPNEMEDFARADGFKSWHEMIDFFAERYCDSSFVGYLIKWKPL